MKKLLLSLFLLLTIFSMPAFADGGVPLWGLNTSVFFTISTVATMPSFFDWGIVLSFWIFTLVILLLVIFVETIVIKKFIKNFDFKKVFKICFKANLISTLVGIILLFLPAPFVWNMFMHSNIAGFLLGPWGVFGRDYYAYSLFLYNFLCLPLSYLVEYYYAKGKLQPDNDIPTIKKAFLCANIITYALPIIIYGIPCIAQFKNSIH